MTLTNRHIKAVRAHLRVGSWGWDSATIARICGVSVAVVDRQRVEMGMGQAERDARHRGDYARLVEDVGTLTDRQAADALGLFEHQARVARLACGCSRERPTMPDEDAAEARGLRARHPRMTGDTIAALVGWSRGAVLRALRMTIEESPQ